jgi:hypothetical protein
MQILDPNKATGSDKISHKMLKISPEKIAKPLLIIFNKSLQQRKYPSNCMQILIFCAKPCRKL